MKKCLLSFLLLFIFDATIYAQSIVGTVTDINGNPVPLVQVNLLGKKNKTYTNGNGFWSLNGISTGDTILFSHIKYLPLVKVVTTSRIVDATIENVPVELQTITVTASKAIHIVRSAIKKIPSNFLTKEYGQYGRVREKLYCNDTLQSMSDYEVILKSSYDDERSDIVTSKNLHTYMQEKKPDFQMGSDPAITYLVDEVKVKSRIFNEKKLKGLSFSIRETIFKEGKQFFVVQFVPIKGKGSNYSGEMYIESEHLGISYLKINAEKLPYDGKADLELFYALSNGKYWMKSCIVRKFENHRVAGCKSRYRGEVLAVMEEPEINTQNQAPITQTNGPLLELKSARMKGNLRENCLEIDSILMKEMTNLHLIADTALRITMGKRMNNLTGSLYKPNLTIQISDKPFQNLSAFNETYNSANRFLFYKLANLTIETALAAGMQTVYTLYFAVPFQSVESERRILFKNGIDARYNPMPVNRYFSSFCKGVSNNQLINLKQSNFQDYLRLHTVGIECNYASIKDIEDGLFVHYQGDREQRDEFSRYFYIDLFMRRLMMMAPVLTAGINSTIPLGVDEARQPLFANRIPNYIHNLLNPSDSLNRNISPNDLNSNEKRHLRRMRWLNIQNLISPLTLGISPFKIGDEFSFTFSLGYLPSILGDCFSQNLWFKMNNSAYRLSFNEYKSATTTGYDIGFRIIDANFLKSGSVSTEVNYWKQPFNLAYYSTSNLEGFSVSQQIKYKMGKTALLLGYRFKTKGYLELSESTGADFSVNFGLNRSF